MANGHNNNVSYGGAVYHVQTEDRGAEHPFIDTTVFSNGRALHRRTNSYHDLLPLSPEMERTLQERVDAQHKSTLEEVRSGALNLIPAPETQNEPGAAGPGLEIELLNQKNWLKAGQARLEVQVRVKSTGAPAAGARVEARIEGAAVPAEYVRETGPNGRAQINFAMPWLGDGEAALALSAAHGPEHAQLRFQLRAKPKAPATPGNRT
jgi:hypothetical protein